MLGLRHATAFVVAGLGIAAAGPGIAATITGWNTDNVVVGPTPADGVTGFSEVYDRDPSDPLAVTNGRIAFTPPEAVSPGIQVQPEVYPQGGPSGITLSGCLMTSNPGATCTSDFQSGKRIKQQMTGLGPVDLVFDISGSDAASTYQVFHRLINLTTQDLAGFTIELGFGVGDEFVQAVAGDGLSFSSLFRAQPSGSGAVSTQFPFGLFGDATDNPNFSLDGFFSSERTGYNVTFSDFVLSSNGIFGPYSGLFGNWLSQDAVPAGAFWDNDNDPGTDALVMAWLNEDGKWEIRREVLDVATGLAGTLATPQLVDTFEEVAAFLGVDPAVITEGPIEDLANLNVNFAIELAALLPFGDGFRENFTLRTTVLAALVSPIPLPAGAPLLLGGFGLLLALRRRRHATA